MKRAPGFGSITPRGARFWVRAPRLPDGRRPSLGVYDTLGEAEQVRAAGVNALADADLTRIAGVTLHAFGERHLDDLEVDGDRSIAHRRARWKHILDAPFIDDAIADILRPVVATWIKKLRKKMVKRGRGPGAKLRKISRTTVRQIVGELSRIFVSAQDEGLCAGNPAAKHRIGKAPAVDEDEDEVWTFLGLDEQRAIIACDAPEADRLMALCAVGSGLRRGEQFSLHLTDVHVDSKTPHVIVRWGGKNRRPKNGKIRATPLFGVGLWAFRRWLELLPTYAPKNPLGLVFPTPRGYRRGPSQHLHRGAGNRIDGFHELLRAAGIARHVRWHDLRHTCASMLISGLWGPVWRLEEVAVVLGHQSVRTTVRYAHLAPAVVADLAARTPGLPMGYGQPAPLLALPEVSRLDHAGAEPALSGSC